MRMRPWMVLVLTAVVLTLLFSGSALAQTFPDVPASHPYYAAIEGMAERDIIGGYTDGDFGPGDLVKRQQFAKMIVLALGYTPTEADLCPFLDVEHKAGDLYPFHFVAKAAAAGLTTGYKDDTFRPGNPISRQQVVTMAVRAAGAHLKTPPAGWSGFYSHADPTHGENVRTAEYNKLLQGIQGSPAAWDATRNATRGECAQILWNLLPLVQGQVQPPAGETGAVTKVVDGDTIHVQIGGQDQTVRLIGIDAPETGEPFSAEAKAALGGLVAGQTVRLEQDVDGTDQYGRTLAYVWVGTAMANAEMLRQGMATLYTVPPNVEYVETLQAAQAEARAAHWGMWAASTDCPLEIASIDYDAPGDDNANLNEEYVTFRVAVSGSLVGYSVEDESGHHYDFPDRVFQKGQVFKLHTGKGTDTQTDLYWGMSGSAVWNNGGDTVKVLDPQGRVLLSRSY